MARNEGLHELFAAAWADEMEESPESATVLGYPGHDDRWTDVSPEAVERRLGKARRLLDDLAAFGDGELDTDDRISRDLLASLTRDAITDLELGEDLLSVDQLQGVQQDPAMILEAQRSTTTAEQERIVERLRRLPALVDQTIDTLRPGLAKPLTPPQICLRDVPQQIANQIVADAFDSPLLVPLAECEDDAI